MDDLKLPSALFLLWDVKRAVESQKSLHVGLHQFAQRQIKDPFSQRFQLIITSQDMQSTLKAANFSIYQKNLVFLIIQGLNGCGIYQGLVRLEKEFISICEDDIEKHTQMLPLILQFPLLGLIFPALMMILLIPVINMLSL